MQIVIDPLELLHNAEHKEDFRKELFVNINLVEKNVPVYYRCYEYPQKALNVFFFGDDFFKYKSYFKKDLSCKLVITKPNYGFSGGELKLLPGEKFFIPCKIIDTRHEFLKVEIV